MSTEVRDKRSRREIEMSKAHREMTEYLKRRRPKRPHNPKTTKPSTRPKTKPRTRPTRKKRTAGKMGKTGRMLGTAAKGRPTAGSRGTTKRGTQSTPARRKRRTRSY